MTTTSDGTFPFGEENDSEDIFASISIVRDGQVSSPSWTVVVPAPRVLSPPFVLDNRSSSSSSSSLFAFQLAPRGGYLTIENNLGWSYELQSQLSYFLDVIAVASSTEVMVSVQNQTHRANVGFLSTTEDVKNTSNFTLFSSSYSLREASEKLARFNAVSFADESGIGSDVSVRSVRLRASSMSDDEGGTRETFATTGGTFLLLPAFGAIGESDENNESDGAIGEEEVTFLFDAKDEDSEKILIVGVSVSCALFVAVLVVVYCTAETDKKRKAFHGQK